MPKQVSGPRSCMEFLSRNKPLLFSKILRPKEGGRNRMYKYELQRLKTSRIIQNATSPCPLNELV